MARRTYYTRPFFHPESLMSSRITKSLVHRPTSPSRPTLQRSSSHQDQPHLRRLTFTKYPPAHSSFQTPSFPMKRHSRVSSCQVRSCSPLFVFFSPPFFFPTICAYRAKHTVDTVERAAGLTLFSEDLKNASKHICKSTKCEVIVRRFDEAQKRPEIRRAVSAPR